MTVRVVFPCGNGGNWLDDVVWHLEHNSTKPTQPDGDIFDAARNSSIRFTHSFETRADGTIDYYPSADISLLFSTSCVFNIYVNHANKYLYRRTGLNQKTTTQQLFELSNCARYHLTDNHFLEQYCKNIDIDAALLLQDPDQFVTQLFAALDSIHFKYTANRRYVLDSIQNYLPTCENVNTVYGNCSSLKWLGCCHAITLIDNIPIDVIVPSADLDQIAQVLAPHNQYCQDRIQPLIAKWKI
jgi:hypothetical protein